MDPASYRTAETLVNFAESIFNGAVDARNNSLTGHLKSTILPGRVYIDEGAASEDVVPDLLRSLHLFYAGLIMNALQMNQVVLGSKTIKDLLNVVATESARDDWFGGVYKEIGAALESMIGGLEAIIPNPGDIVDPETGQVPTTDDPNKDKDKGKNKPATPKLPENNGPRVGSSKEITLSNDVTLPLSKIVEVVLGNPNDPKHRAIVNITIQLLPYIVPGAIAPAFITTSMSHGWQERWLQVRAGEISFWKDFIFQADRIRDRSRIARADKSGALGEFQDLVSRKDSKSVGDQLTKERNDRSRNLSSNMMVFTEDTVARAKAAIGIDLHRTDHRETYMRNTFTLILAIVDPRYARVSLYFHGMKDSGTYSYQQFKGPRKGVDPTDLVSILASLGRGQAPKF